jgi:hypothetical protein
MTTLDGFSDACSSLLEGSYDCVDRIVVNAYFPMGQSPAGFRYWWRQLVGSDACLDDTHLMRIAGHFGRRVRAWAGQHGIPVIYCKSGERKDQIADRHLPKDPNRLGLFLVLVSKAPALVWQVRHYGENGMDLRRRNPWPYVNYYHFHVIDAEWGHITIKMSAHPPFGAQIILNGHEWVSRRLKKRDIDVTKEDNCFVRFSDPAGLGEIADTLSSPNSIGRLSQLCDSWIYSCCLCFGLSIEEQEKSQFRYRYSSYQIEYSRNLLFRSGREMEQIYQSTIDRTRTLLDLRRVCTIFGSRYRPHTKRLRKERFQVTTEKPNYDLTVFKIHFGKLTLKIYDKGARLLRIEVVVHNTKALKLGRGIGLLPTIISMLKQILVRFLDVVRSLSVEFLDTGFLDQLPSPTLTGHTRLAGVNLQSQRMRDALRAFIALSPAPSGFTITDFAAKIQELTDKPPTQYTIRNAAYDLKKIRGKGLAEKIDKTYRYRPLLDPCRKLFAWLILDQKVIRPLVSSGYNLRTGRRPSHFGPLDIHYINLKRELNQTLNTLALAS